MRLRYLQLPRCGPLSDTAIVFGREDLIAETLDLPRTGSLNFVVGVNGSGRSFLLALRMESASAKESRTGLRTRISRRLPNEWMGAKPAQRLSFASSARMMRSIRRPDTLGSRFHRAELRAILKRLKSETDAPSSR